MWRRFAQHFAPGVPGGVARGPGHKSRCIVPTSASFSWPPTSTPSSAPQQPHMSRVRHLTAANAFLGLVQGRLGGRSRSAGGVGRGKEAGRAHLDATLVGPQPLLAEALRPLLLAHLQHLHRPLLKRRKAHRLLDDLAHERHALGARVLRGGHGARLAARSRPPPSSPAGRSGPRSPAAEKAGSSACSWCFPDGNVALHKEWARASLIIAYPPAPEPRRKTRRPPPRKKPRPAPPQEPEPRGG